MRGKLLLFVFFLLSLLSFRKDKTAKAPVFNARYIETHLRLVPQSAYRREHTDSPVPPEYYSCDSFYLFQYEVSNAFYHFYLNELKRSDSLAAQQAIPDTTLWAAVHFDGSVFQDYYYSNAYYINFPVVNVSWAQGRAFCQWLTRYYNALPDRKFRKVSFDLPDAMQYCFAAWAGDYEAAYPWGYKDVRDSAGGWRANFREILQTDIFSDSVIRNTVYGPRKIKTAIADRGYPSYRDEEKNSADILAPVDHYKPNAFGFYNLSGNAAELMLEKGKTFGGSWNSTGAFLQIEWNEEYPDSASASPERGFRFAMKVLEK